MRHLTRARRPICTAGLGPVIVTLLPLPEPGDVEQVLMHAGAGYVSETHGAVHEIRAGSTRVVRPEPR